MGTSLYEAALDAIREVFSDTSVDQAETARDLSALKDEIDTMIDSLDV